MKVLQTSQPGEWAVLISSFPGREREPIGIIIRDVTRNLLDVKIRENWWAEFQKAEGMEIWGTLANDIRQQALEMGANEYLNWFESSCSHVLQISSRQSVLFQDMTASLSTLYEEEVEGKFFGVAPAQAKFEQLTGTTSMSIKMSKVRVLMISLNDAWSNIWSIRMLQHAAMPSCVVAVTCMVIAVFAFVMSREPQSEPFVAIQRPLNVSSPIDFPPLALQRKALELELDSPELSLVRVNINHRAKIRRQSHRVFALPLSSPKIPVVQVARIERVPAPRIHFENKSVAGLAPAMTSLPKPPKYHSRNRFLRLLNALGRSFGDGPRPSTLITGSR